MEVLVQKTVQDLLGVPGKPVPINVSRIGKHIGKLALLEQVVETDGEYQLRKIDWAVTELETEGIKPKRWRVVKKVGIKYDKYDAKNRR